MIEIEGNIFALSARDADAICIMTNGNVRHGRATMGRGTAQVARDAWPGVDRILGQRIQGLGHHVHRLTTENRMIGVCCLPWHVYSFPTKNDWRQRSSLELIKQSCHELRLFPGVIVLPRPGAGYGGLDWSITRAVLKELLPEDRFRVINPP